MNNKQQEMERNEKIKQEHEKGVTARGLKDILWESLGDLRRNRIDADKASGIAKVAQGILTTVKLEIEVAKMMGGGLSAGLTDFTYNGDVKLITKVNPNGEAKAYQTLRTVEEPKGY